MNYWIWLALVSLMRVGVGVSSKPRSVSILLQGLIRQFWSLVSRNLDELELYLRVGKWRGKRWILYSHSYLYYVLHLSLFIKDVQNIIATLLCAVSTVSLLVYSKKIEYVSLIRRNQRVFIKFDEIFSSKCEGELASKIEERFYVASFHLFTNMNAEK